MCNISYFSIYCCCNCIMLFIYTLTVYVTTVVRRTMYHKLEVIDRLHQPNKLYYSTYWNNKSNYTKFCGTCQNDLCEKCCQNVIKKKKTKNVPSATANRNINLRFQILEHPVDRLPEYKETIAPLHDGTPSTKTSLHISSIKHH